MIRKLPSIFNPRGIFSLYCFKWNTDIYWSNFFLTWGCFISHSPLGLGRLFRISYFPLLLTIHNFNLIFLRVIPLDKLPFPSYSHCHLTIFIELIHRRLKLTANIFSSLHVIFLYNITMYKFYPPDLSGFLCSLFQLPFYPFYCCHFFLW